MHFLLLTDIGQRIYHVGDEAIGIQSAKYIQERGHVPILLTRDLHASHRDSQLANFSLARAFPLPQNLGVSHHAYKWSQELAKQFLTFPSAPRPSEESAAALYDLVQQVQESDGVILGGGGSFNSEYGWLFKERLLLGKIAQMAGKPLVITGQTLGPALSKTDLQIAAEVFSHACLIGFRDSTSLRLFERHFPHLKAHLSLDDASFFAIAEDTPEKKISKEDSPLVVSLSSSGFSNSVDTEIKNYASLIDGFYEATGHPSLMVPHMSLRRSYTGDEEFHYHLKNSLSSPSLFLETESATPSAQRINQAAMVLTSRFHPLIFSLSRAVPALPISNNTYSHIRLQGALENWGLDNQLLTDAKDLSTPTALDRMLEVWEKRDAITGFLNEQRHYRQQEVGKWWDRIIASLTQTNLPQPNNLCTFQAPQIIPADVSYNLSTQIDNLSKHFSELEEELESLTTPIEENENPFVLQPLDEYIQSDRRKGIPMPLQSIDKTPINDFHPRVTVIVRTKNRENFLRRALADITAQTYRPLEVIVVNDGGSATAVDEVVSFFNQEKIITVIHNETSRGMEHASNQALKCANGKYIAIHDDDDTWEISFLKQCVSYLEEHTAAAAVSVRTEIVYEEEKEDGQIIETGRAPAWPEIQAISLSALLHANQCVPISCLYKKDALEALGGFDASLPVVGDWQMHLRLARKYEFGFIDGSPLAFWHQRPHSLGNSANSIFAADKLHKHFDTVVRNQVARQHLSDSNYALGLLLTQNVARYREDVQKHLTDTQHEVSVRLEELERNLRDLQKQQQELAKVTDEIARNLETLINKDEANIQKMDWLLYKADRNSLFSYCKIAVKRILGKK
ncbi:polysaccharide pyruvyl transferase family protein [Actinomycetaceae bacterium TAE3-ERU4]|nr:polysaccharide pyruvyl transferase family protein [Actinomycetaceae bacterium TAE3-ERU4]